MKINSNVLQCIFGFLILFSAVIFFLLKGKFEGPYCAMFMVGFLTYTGIYWIWKSMIAIKKNRNEKKEED